MKIAYDSQIFCSQTYGGVSRYFSEIASHLARQPGVEISVIAPMHINSYLQYLPRAIVTGFRAPKYALLKSRAPVLALRAAGILLGDLILRTKSPDIVHETYYFPYRLGPRSPRRVLTIYDMIHEKFASDFPRGDKTAQYKALAAKRADHVVCISESTRRDVIEILGLPPDKLTVIHLGFDLMGIGDSITSESTLPVVGPFLLYVGNRGGYKNFLRLLEAYGTSVQLRSNFKLVCFGGGALRPNELDSMKRLGIDEESVIQLGGDDQLLCQLYGSAAAFVYPSLYEGFGIPPLEAMSHNCPVICANTSSIPEVVADAGEYFAADDIEAIRSAIESVVGSESRREQLIEGGRERLKSFSWDRCAAETLNVYKKLT